MWINILNLLSVHLILMMQDYQTLCAILATLFFEMTLLLSKKASLTFKFQLPLKYKIFFLVQAFCRHRRTGPDIFSE